MAASATNVRLNHCEQQRINYRDMGTQQRCCSFLAA
ncbi:hypothetical protein FRAAL5459 [Frankia alni ACN14a]|uniref:Uncharacterized protein n=1 Tax=Frankia alni (strain DSM 45986 / CECT 9034 / ACN14a) TaxID=326424 RepID=Q0REL6_FRAAA|nr:hypothetical protein FRAAL5459 [Frankia alni ACN14a]